MLGDGDTLQMVINRRDGQLSIALMPGASANGTPIYMKPLMLTGSPQKLDEMFFEQVTEPIENANKLVSNLKEFNEGLKKEKANSSMAQSEKKEIDKLNQEAEKFEKLKNYNAAISALNKVLGIASADKQAISKRIAALKSKSGEGTLFEDDANQIEESEYTINEEKEE